jgi:hypothetical protein
MPNPVNLKQHAVVHAFDGLHDRRSTSPKYEGGRFQFVNLQVPQCTHRIFVQALEDLQLRMECIQERYTIECICLHFSDVPSENSLDTL